MRKKMCPNILAMILVLALLVSSIPTQAFAVVGDTSASGQELDAPASPLKQDSTIDISALKNVITNEFFVEAYIIGEDEGKRSEFYKEYILSNGARLATIYPSSIHYDENGKWKDIDNTLVAMISDGNAFYTNTAGKLNIRFPQNLTTNGTICVTKSGFSVQFGMAGELRSSGGLVVASAGQIGSESTAGILTVSAAQPSSAQIQQIDLTAARAEAEYPETVLDRLTSRLIYTNIFPNTDVIYDLQGNQLKESIILQQYDSTLWGYRYTLNAGNLVPVLNEDQHIDLCDPNTDEVVLTMPAPYLVDDNGVFNYDVDVSLVRNGSGYWLSYYLPQEWLAEEERAWPVVLDPVITEPGTYTNVQDRTVTENYAEANTLGTIQCGYYSKAGAMRFFMQFLELPRMTSADVIIDATISLYKPYNSGTTANVEVHKVTETWLASEITWATQPSFDTNIEDYVVCKLANTYTWNITDIVRGWYETANNGMMFKVPSDIETAGTDNWKQFYSSDYSNTTATMPTLTITYHNNNGLENYWDYTSTSAGRAGTAHVQNYSGNLVWVHSDIGFDGNRMPVSISHIYNTDDAWDIETNAGINEFGMGNGWRTNFNQTITPATDSDGIVYYIWEDGDGTAHDFFANADGVYKDIDDLGLTLTVTTAGYTITDKYDNTSNFDTYGRLKSQYNNQATKSSIIISYIGTTNMINLILDGASRTYEFYYENNLLSEIAYYGTYRSDDHDPFSAVSFAYTNNNLTAITYADGKTSSFTYTTKNMLSTATDIDGYQIAFGYNTLENNKSSRVVSISESHIKEDETKAGNATTIQYAYHYTTITKVKVSEEEKDVFHTYFFNEWGNTISVQDSKGNAVFYQYATDVAENGIKNRPITVSQEMGSTVNLLKDTSFENGTMWTAGAGSTACAIVEDATLSLDGDTALKSTCSQEYGGVVGASYGTISVPAGAAYTFSAYMKTEGSQARLRIKDNTNAYVDSEWLDTNTAWTRLEVTYTNTSSAARTVTVCVAHLTPGTAFIDCVQLEKNEAASKYNMATDSDISSGIGTTSSAWSYYSASTGRPTVAAGESVYTLNGNMVCINGDIGARQYVYQIVTFPGAEGDRYVFTGWTKGNALPSIGGNRFYGLALVFNYTDGTTGEVKISADPHLGSTRQWQYLAVFAKADKAYDSITIRAEYSYNANTVYFDGLQLYKEEFGESYEYDASGNVQKVRNAIGQETTYLYNAKNDVYLSIQPSKVMTFYTYDSYHNVLEAVTKHTDDSGNVTVFLTEKYTYDVYGNLLTQSTVQGDIAKTTSAEYTGYGNLLSSVTDEVGNKTTFGYDPDTSVLNWVKDPKNTETYRTNYTYDSMFRLVSTSANVSSGKTMSATYTYENDNIAQIATGSTTYSFVYGDFALRTQVSIGSRLLAKYEYTNDANKYLKLLEYGNEDVVEYSYDDLGRVTQETYRKKGSSTILRTITYTYDNAGALATMVDSETGVTTKYYYDTVGRALGTTDSINGKNHGIWYTYNVLGQVSEMREVYDGTSSVTCYYYDESGRVMVLERGSTTDVYAYDEHSRLIQQNTYHGNTLLLTKDVTYKAPTSSSTSSQITKLDYSNAANYDLELSYTYDANGNILSVSDGTHTTTYVYDSANQLIRENNHKAGKTWYWTYDGAGNIETRKEYEYSTGAMIVLLDTVYYSYGDTEWGDLLTAYDGVAITYDDIGNPLSDGTWTYTWKYGRQLASMTSGTTTWNYTYDANGMRTGRTSNSGTTYTYVYNGSQLSRMTYGSNTLIFAYDASGSPMTVTYAGNTFYYVTNLQGDVIAILNSAGTAVVQYTYDAWGKVLTTTGTMAPTLGLINPLRYRGYVYDRETGLYYLQSRYYNPTWGRFISADNYPSTGQGLIGNNMFAYCGNNPVIRMDASGEAFETVFDIVTLCFSVVDVVRDPTDVGAWIGLVGDVVDLIPFVTGVGETARALRITDKIVDGFGGLSKAKQYGIKAYNALKKTLKGTGLEAHHIIEQRLVKHLDIDVKTMLSVAVTKAEHQKFTNAWRKTFEYGMDYSTLKKSDIWKAAQKIYKDYPELLNAAKSILFS